MRQARDGGAPERTVQPHRIENHAAVMRAVALRVVADGGFGQRRDQAGHLELVSWADDAMLS
jgi:hypothetical protein